MKLNTVPEIIEDIRAGKMVVIMDDEDRENEGDLVMAASHCRAEDINFMAKHARGLVCLTLTRERCQQLHLPLMVSQNDDLHGTNFTMSIEAAEGVTTGISAADRAKTVQVAVSADATPADIVQPGHIFPVMAQPGGVLARAGHTETGCDLARMAGVEPAAVIVEIMNDDGSMARRPDLEVFAAKHDLKIGTVADLIRYRIENEHTVERVAETVVNTEYGDFRMVCYEDAVDQAVHIAMVKGDIKPGETQLVRVHVANMLSDVLAINSEEFSWPLRDAMRRIEQEGSGVVVVLRKPQSPRDLVHKVHELFIQGEPEQRASDGEESTVLRTYGVGAQILTDLGVQKMRVLSAPKKLQGISGFGLEVVEYVHP